MKKIVLFKIGSKSAQLPRLVGAFLIVISILMLIQSGAVMFDSWTAVKEFNVCIDKAYSIEGEVQGLDAILSELKYQDCKNSLYQITGAQVTGGKMYLTSRQFWTAFTTPVSIFFVWAIIFLFALFLFNSSSIVVPVEQIEIPLNKNNSLKRIFKSKKKK
ncbi:MAG: hypothetical protein PHP82_01155 [Candidatus ainarchaeum sp.]|nr:hypothetical protein [Candidatus ainarchaeum sp.]